MKPIRLVLLLFLVVLSIRTVSGQRLDPSFQAPLPIRAAYINAIVVQPDGRILLGGDIKFYGTQRVHNLIRLEADGSLDESFSFAGQDDMVIDHLALLRSGEIVALAHPYDSYNDFSPGGNGALMKVSPDGTIKKEVSNYFSHYVFAVDDAGRVLVVKDKLTRYNADLTPDETFQPSNVSTGVTAVALTGEKILVARFSSIEGVTKGDIVRLNADGSVDAAFDTGEGTKDYIGSMTVQSDGKILLGNCYINSFDGVPAGGLIRLNADGSVDTGFNPPRANGPISRVIASEDGVYVAAFLQYGGVTSDRLFRLNRDNGGLDQTFPPARLEEFGAISLRMDMAGDQIILNETQIEGNVFGLSRIKSDGTYDEIFLPEVSRYGTIKIADIHQGKMLVAGDFIRMNGMETYGIARLSLNGELDGSFRLKENKGIVYQLKVLEGDDVLVTTYKNFFKLDSQGNEKPEFSWAPFKLQHQVIKFSVLPDGKIMSADPNLIYRLNADGSEDTSFDIEDICCVRSTAFDFDVQGDKVIWGSAFSAVGSVAANRLVRLTAGADADPSFDIGTGPNDHVTLVKVLNNNEIVVGGYFDQFDGRQLTLSLVKLSPDGKVDTEFYNNLQRYPALPHGIVHSRKVEQLGSMIYFQHWNGIYALGIDGTAYPDFHIPAVVSAVSDIITITDGPGSGGRQKSETGVMYALGNFAVEGDESPSFLLKLNVDVTAPVPPEVTTGVEEDAAREAFTVEVYPQPVKNKLSVSIDGVSGIYTAELFDLTGRRLLEASLDFNAGGRPPELDIATAADGVYFIKLTSNDGKYSFVRIVKGK